VWMPSRSPSVLRPWRGEPSPSRMSLPSTSSSSPSTGTNGIQRPSHSCSSKTSTALWVQHFTTGIFVGRDSSSPFRPAQGAHRFLHRSLRRASISESSEPSFSSVNRVGLRVDVPIFDNPDAVLLEPFRRGVAESRTSPQPTTTPSLEIPACTRPFCNRRTSAETSCPNGQAFARSGRNRP
jgi:hypothetical protein